MTFSRIPFRFLAVSALLFANQAYASGASASAINTQLDARQPAEAVHNVLNAYSDAYPEITFLHLQDERDYARLENFVGNLGDGARNVDYEHPPESRLDLIAAQAYRIRLMLAERLPSSTIFTTGTNSGTNRPYACVITLNVDMLTSDTQASTRFFFSEGEQGPDIYINNNDFLNFALHHEIFHCLDAYINGPTRPMTDSEVMISYNNFRAEQRAELYAAMMHRARNTSTQMLKLLASVRTMSLVNGDLEHYTSPILEYALNLEASSFSALTLPKRVEFAMQRADEFVIAPTHYPEFATAAIEVYDRQGGTDGSLTPIHHELQSQNYPINEDIVRDLSNRIRIAQLYFASTRLSQR